MLSIQQTKTSFQIIYNDHLLLEHSIQQPALFVGHGIEDISFYRGNYKIKDYIESRIPLKDFLIEENRITFKNQENKLTLTFTEKEHLLEISMSENSSNRFWIRIKADHEESVFGLGEQASYFNVRGRNFPLWTSEPGVGRDKTTLTTFYADRDDQAGGDYYNTYYPEPTYVSSKLYWLHVNSFAYAEFNFEHKDFHELHFWEIPQSIVVGTAKSYPNLLTNLTSFTGRPPQLPDFVLDGMILGVQGGTEVVSSFLSKSENAGASISGIWCQDWAGVNHTSFGKRLYWNWMWNQELYPNLDYLIQEMNQKNQHFLAYICPFLLRDESLYNYAKAQKYLVLTKDSKIYDVDFGEFYCGLVDLTNPDAFAWYKKIIKQNLIDLGISGWMADFGEYLPHDAVLYNGLDAKLMHNEWPVLWAKCNFEAVSESNKIGKVFYFMRAGGFGSQKYATALWAGDQSVNWELHDGIASTIPSALSVGMTGNPYTHSDIGGYTSLHGNIRTKELFERWLEMSVFTAIMRSHEGNRPSQNFQFYNNENTLTLMGRMTQIRKLLKPYIKHLFIEASELGYPVQRPYFFHYPDDPEAMKLQYEYFFGSDMIVKPVVHEGQTSTEVYLPTGEWVNLWDGSVSEGKKWVTATTIIGYPPVYYNKQSRFQHVFEEITKEFGKGE